MNVQLSVGVPTFNQSGYLRETLLSLLNQETPPYEIVVSDNHSTDETPKVLAEFENKIKVVKPPRHLVMMENWNFLVENLRGNWFTLLSSDDLAKPNFAHALIKGASRSARAVLVRAGWENIDAKGKVLDTHYLLSVRKRVSPPQTFYENLAGPKTSFAAFAVRTDAWKKVAGFPVECKLFGDWGLWLKLSPYGDFIYEHEIVSGYRTNYRPGLETARLKAEVADELVINTKIIPEIAAMLGVPGSRRVATASRNCFVRRLSTISRLIGPDIDDDLLSSLESWAVAANSQRIFHEFREGRVIRPLTNPLRQYLRHLIQYVRS